MRGRRQSWWALSENWLAAPVVGRISLEMGFLKQFFTARKEAAARQEFAVRVQEFERTLSAMFMEGKDYATFTGVKNQDSQILAFLECSANLGDPIALCCLGEYLTAGGILSPDFEKAESCLRLAYKLGDLPALPRLGHLAIARQSPPVQLEELSEMMVAERTRASSYDEILRTTNLGYGAVYRNFQGIRYRQAIAGDADAQNNIARDWIFSRALGNPAVAAEAWRLSKSAAMQGSAKAQVQLVELHCIEHSHSNPRDGWGYGISSEDMIKVATKDSLMWAILAAAQQLPLPAATEVSLAQTYVDRVKTFHGDEMFRDATQAAKAIAILPSAMTLCTRATKALLEANDGEFPIEWREQIERQ